MVYYSSIKVNQLQWIKIRNLILAKKSHIYRRRHTVFFLFINFKNLQSNYYVNSQDHVVCEEGEVVIVRKCKGPFRLHTIYFQVVVTGCSSCDKSLRWIFVLNTFSMCLLYLNNLNGILLGHNLFLINVHVHTKKQPWSVYFEQIMLYGKIIDDFMFFNVFYFTCFLYLFFGILKNTI